MREIIKSQESKRAESLQQLKMKEQVNRTIKINAGIACLDRTNEENCLNHDFNKINKINKIL